MTPPRCTSSRPTPNLHFLAFVAAAFAVSAAQAADDPAPSTTATETLATCAALADDPTRLACYDRLAGRPASAATPVPAGRTPDVVLAPPAPITAGDGLVVAPPARTSFLSKFWELDAADKRGVFNFTGYRPNFLLPIHSTTRLNRSPTSPTRGTSQVGADYQNTEAKFQLSLRTKVLENVGLPGADVWVGYTQQSLWQFYNDAGSKPFRATDYEPEAMYVVPVPASIGALPFDARWRFVTLGIAHQSNGQPDPLSRSWNRMYLATGFERNDWSLQWRINRRFKEDASTDDNPDLITYRGRQELLLGWTPGLATAALQWRTNFNDLKRGSVQLDWSYPVNAADPRALRWYVQLFNGYSETLIDYNFRQTSVGVGLSLFEF